MAFNDIVYRRLEVLINTLKGQEINIDLHSKLGVPPIGFDDVFIQGEFRGYLNGNPIGLADILTRAIAKSDADESTTLADLVEAILKKSSVGTRDLYEAKMGERVRLGLRHYIVLLAKPPIDEKDILPTKKVSDYLSSSSVDTLRDALNGEFRKYLIGGAIQKRDLNGTLNAVKDDVVLRMLA